MVHAYAVIGLIALFISGGYGDYDFKVFQGIDASTHEFPFLVAIFSYDKEGLISLQCTGSIVSSHFILTAAHCISPRLAYVGIGHATSRKTFKYEIAQVYAHPQYVPNNSDFNDVGLIRVKNKIYAGAGVTGIHLPQNVPNGNILLIGFGFVPINLNDPYKFGQVVVEDFNLLSPSKAQYAVLNPTLFSNDCDNTDNRIQFCYYQTNKGVTQGDSGGPLVVYDGEEFHQIGITSSNMFYALNPGQIEVTSVFTRISAYCDWIEQASFGEVYCE